MKIRTTSVKKQSAAGVALHFAAAMHPHSNSATAAQQQRNDSAAAAQQHLYSSITAP